MKAGTTILGVPAANGAFRDRIIGLAAVIVVLLLCFALPLYDLIRFAWESELYSHILLVPFVSAYLIWLKRSELTLESSPARAWACLPLAVGLGVVARYWQAVSSGWRPDAADYLSAMTLSFLLLVYGCGVLFLGAHTLLQAAFPVGFLIFAVPFPTSILKCIETFLQYWSAGVAHVFFIIAGTPVLKEGTFFQLPGFSLQVEPECSGIHSTLALFITSLVLGYLFLRNPWKRSILTLAVIPLALLRNGFRIFVVGELCVNVSPDMINSYIHRKGGPIFFALSLVPFFALLFWLRRKERKQIAMDRN